MTTLAIVMGPVLIAAAVAVSVHRRVQQREDRDALRHALAEIARLRAENVKLATELDPGVANLVLGEYQTIRQMHLNAAIVLEQRIRGWFLSRLPLLGPVARWLSRLTYYDYVMIGRELGLEGRHEDALRHYELARLYSSESDPTAQWNVFRQTGIARMACASSAMDVEASNEAFAEAAAWAKRSVHPDYAVGFTYQEWARSLAAWGKRNGVDNREEVESTFGSARESLERLAPESVAERAISRLDQAERDANLLPVGVHEVAYIELPDAELS